MLRMIFLILVMFPLIATAEEMSAHEEVRIITSAIAEIKKTPNHPQADSLGSLINALDDRLAFIDRSKKDNRYVIVNIGSQRLTIVENELAVDSQKVIVGRDSRRTPEFSDKLRYIVTNPYWNVPRSLAAKDVIPKITENPAILDEYGYEMLNTATNRPVAFNPNADLRRFRMRQQPSEKNALGQVKFMFDPVPNRNIYLHDTPDKHLFDNDVRRYSSGCIRLEDSARFAKYLYGGEVPQSNIDDRWLRLPEAVTVHIIDWPVYVDEKGELILNDYTGETFEFITTNESQGIYF